MTVLSQYDRYKDDWGLVHSKVVKTYGLTGNAIRYTAEAIYVLKIVGEDPHIFKNPIISCERIPGLLWRHPAHWSDTQQGPDDYIAYAFAAHVLNEPAMAQRVIDYGNETGWVFKNGNLKEVSRFSPWLGRFPQLIAHYYFAAKKNPPRYTVAAWLAVILYSAYRTKKSNYDGWVLAWKLVRTAKGKGMITDWVRRKWIKQFKKAWPGGIGHLLGFAYNDMDHPSAVHLVGEFGE